jgi:hypothetical protein
MAKPPSAYQAFLTKLNQPEAVGILRSMKLFVRNALAATNLSVDELSEAAQAFFQQTEAAIAEHPLWAGCDQVEFDRTCDGVEKFVMTKLYDRVFASESSEAREDRQLHLWLQRLQFLRVEHLAISPEYQELAPWTSAQQELAKISSYRTPRDKLVCILNCCKRINSALAQASAGGHGADEFFPVLLFVTLRAAPAGLHASLLYISRFRHASKLVSESAYYLTHLQSAMSFLSSVQPEQLTIEPAEFESGLAETHALLELEQAATSAKANALEAAATAFVAESEAAAAANEANGHPSSEVPIGESGGSPLVRRELPPRTPPSRAVARALTVPPTPQILTPDLGSETLPHSLLAMPAASRASSAPLPLSFDKLQLRPSASAVLLRTSVRLDAAGSGAPRVLVDLELVSAAERRKRLLIQEHGSPPSLQYLDVRNVGELTIGDVRQLLQEYQWLSRVLKAAGASHE